MVMTVDLMLIKCDLSLKHSQLTSPNVMPRQIDFKTMGFLLVCEIVSKADIKFDISVLIDIFKI